MGAAARSARVRVRLGAPGSVQYRTAPGIENIAARRRGQCAVTACVPVERCALRCGRCAEQCTVHAVRWTGWSAPRVAFFLQQQGRVVRCGRLVGVGR